MKGFEVVRYAQSLAMGLVLIMGVGCARQSSLLLERKAVGPILEEQGVGHLVEWKLDPTTQTQTQGGVEVSATHAPQPYLVDFFRNKQIFGKFAGLNPFFGEQLVFHVKISNHSGKKLLLDPAKFVLLDDRSNQYAVHHTDYMTALAESKAPLTTMTRGILEEANPGYFGVGVPVGRLIGKPQQRQTLLEMSILKAGPLYDGVVYDGLIAFWNPSLTATRLRLLLTGFKTDANPNDQPQTALDFPFEFVLSRP